MHLCQQLQSKLLDAWFQEESPGVENKEGILVASGKMCLESYLSAPALSKQMCGFLHFIAAS